jgi:hypothetical protein
MDSLPGEILGEILNWLTPVEISRFGVVSRGILTGVLKLLNVDNLKMYIDRWRCDGCGGIFPFLQKCERVADCDHILRKVCKRCDGFAGSAYACDRCMIDKRRICTWCRHLDEKLVESICEHGWVIARCSDILCEYYCSACNRSTFNHLDEDGNGFMCKCGQYNRVEQYPKCMCVELRGSIIKQN